MPYVANDRATNGSFLEPASAPNAHGGTSLGKAQKQIARQFDAVLRGIDNSAIAP
jgi:hypothetical protein